MYTMLRKFRRQHKITQGALAKSVGVSPFMIECWEINHRVMGATYAEQIAARLGCMARDLVLFDSEYQVIGNKIDPESAKLAKKAGRVWDL